jgi:hypothetical protein
MFSEKGRVRYLVRRDDFPSLACQRGTPAPPLPRSNGDTCLSDHVEADWRDWLYGAPEGDLVIQTLHQQNGFAITLLAVDGGGRDDEA